MATLALGLAGAVVGGFVGGPIGASIGFSIGSAVGNVLFAPTNNQNITSQGPRLSDLKVQSSTYGNMIPIAYGTIRFSGNMIWSTNIIETAHVTTTTQDSGGGKGGGAGGGSTTQTTTTYTYSVNSAFAICEGEIVGVRRIWANGNLIFDQQVSNSGISQAFSINGNGGNVAIYVGDETQVADPLIESYLGAGNVPGFRGLAYVVFNNFQLADYSNAIPNFTFEVIRAGSVVTSGIRLLQDDVSSVPYVFSNPSDGCVYAIDTVGETIYKVDPVTNAIINSRTDSVYANFTEYFYDQITATLYFRISGNSYCSIDPTTLIPIFAWDSFAPANIGGYPFPYIAFSDTQLSRLYGAFISGSSPVVTRINVFTANSPNNNNAIFQYQLSNVAVNLNAFDNSTGYLWGFNDPTLAGIPTYAYFWNVRSGLGAPINSTLLFPHSSISAINVLASIIDPITHRLLFYYVGDDSNYYILKIDLSSVAIISTTQVTSNFDGISPQLNSLESKLFWFSDNHTITLFNIKTDELTTIPYPYTSVSNISSASYDPRTDSLIWGLTDHDEGNCIFRIIGTRIEKNNHTLAFVVSDLCNRVNLTDDDIDVSLLTKEVDGYVIANVATVRTAIQQLMQAYYFDAVESDYIVKFVPRGASSITTITKDELAAHSYGDQLPDILTITRTQDLELPSNVNITYYDGQNDYNQGMQYSTRAFKIVEKVLSVNLAMVFTSDFAKSIADTLLYDFWVGRQGYKFQTVYSQMAYEPTDVITLVNDTATYLVRITKKTIQAGMIIFEAVDENPSIYSQSNTGSSPDVPVSNIALSSLTRFFYLDIPQVRDGDNSPGVYLAVAPANPAAVWTGATVVRSIDQGNSYQEASTFFTAAACGVSTSVLGDWDRGNIFDYKNTVTIQMINGDLSSITELQALNGFNFALLGNELIIFKTAEEISIGVYKLRDFLRGRFGTEQYIATHTTVERFILITTPTVHRLAETLNDINSIRLYRPVTFRTQLFTSTVSPQIDTGVSLKPLSAINLKGQNNYPTTHDITITWVRRTRIGGGWNDYADVPLGEETEAYEIDILNTGSVVRTLTSTTTSVVYTAAQQIIDFGSYQTNIDVIIYQMSASVGRGFGASGTI